MKILLLIILGILMNLNLWAHPVSYAGSTSFMVFNDKKMTDWMLIHSLTARNSIGLHYNRFETESGKRELYFPTANFLLKRINTLGSQANLYWSMGYGVDKKVEQKKEHQSGAGILSLETDWESRKYYTSFKFQSVLPSKHGHEELHSAKFRIGMAPYIGQFEELNTWLILQVEKNTNMMEEYSFTPLLRFYYKNILTETGVNHRGDTMFNFMVHF